MQKITPIEIRLFAAAFAAIGSLANAQAGSFSSDFNSGLPTGTAVYDVATVAGDGGIANSGCLKLIDENTSGTGSFIIDDLDAGTPIVSFTATFKALIGSLGNGADGMSFSFAPDLPLSGMGEAGGGTGLTVSFDSYANSLGDAPSTKVSVGGIQVAASFGSSQSPGLRPGRFVDVVIQLKPDNTLTVIYDGIYAYSNLNLTAYSYTPAASSLFGFAARCGTITDNHFIDDLSIVTRTSAGAFVQSFAPQGRRVSASSPIDILLDDSTTHVNGGIVLKLDGATVTPTVNTASGETSIHFAPASNFDHYTTHSVSLTFNDDASPTPKTTTLGYSFTIIPNFVPVFSDGFESYTGGGAPLDMNTAGANASANGNLAGNPWFGPAPPNARVVGTEGSVSPHGGSQMIRGSAPSDLDENWYNLSYRQHNQIPYSGNIMLDFWFYDPLGAGGTAFGDYAAIGYYNTCPNDTDYPGTGSLNGSGQIQRLSLGASANQAAGFDNTKYQARVVNASDGYYAGWFNLPVTRTVGWHHGRIVIEGKVPNSAPDAIFYIDDMVNPCFSHNAILVYGGYNVIEINTNQKATSGYFDDVTFSVARPPNLVLTQSGNNVVLTWPGDGFVLQSASDAAGPYSDVTDAVSGYSYDTTTGPQQFFRLRP
jgi:Bacterial lectin